MAFKVALTNPSTGREPSLEREALTPIGAEIVPVMADDEASYAEQLREVDAVIVGPKVNVTAAVIGKMERCKLIMATGIGLDKIDLDAATAAGIPVANVPDVFTEEVADQAFALLLAVNRKLPYCVEMARSGRWAQTQAGMGSVPKINGKTLGLVAFGNIAKAVARRAQGFGLRAIAHDPFVKPDQMSALGVESATLDDVFSQSDFVSAHAPHSKATHHMIGTAQFALMKPDAIFINTGRGRVVDEQALIAALREGKLAGAGLDVLEEEPASKDNPLLAMDNVVVTPHVAAYSNESLVARRIRHGEEIAAVLSGRRPRNCANAAVLDRLDLK